MTFSSHSFVSPLLFGVMGCLLASADLTSAADPPMPPSSQPVIHVECHGKLRHGVVAIGGETTGTTISINGVTWELNLPDETARTFAAGHHKEFVTAVGSLRQVRGTEIPVRWIVHVEKPTLADKRDHPQGIDVNIRGMLQSDRSAGPNLHMTIESQKVVWPVDVSAKCELASKAQAFVGKPVQLMGRLEWEKNAKNPSQPILRVENLNAPPASQSRK